MLYGGRSLLAMAVCLQMSSINVYIAETAHPNIRGSLVIHLIIILIDLEIVFTCFLDLIKILGEHSTDVE